MTVRDGDPAEIAGGHDPLRDALHGVREELVRLEAAISGGRQAETGSAAQPVPAWMRETVGENRLYVGAVVVLAIALQLTLPDRLTMLNRWVLPALELALLIALAVASPRRFERESPMARAASLTLSGLVTLANGWSAVMLVLGLIEGREGEDAGPLLAAGGAIWLTNVIAFGLWYWQFDRGGPAARVHARQLLPDFLFVQMQSPQFADPEWEPTLVDYQYLSFTNALAFSPTDVMPLSRWAKVTMLVQSLVSVTTVALVVARAVNVLK